MALELTSSVFQLAARSRALHLRCGHISPPLAWTGCRVDESLALIVDDPDAPDPKAPRMTWVHGDVQLPRQHRGWRLV